MVLISLPTNTMSSLNNADSVQTVFAFPIITYYDTADIQEVR